MYSLCFPVSPLIAFGNLLKPLTPFKTESFFLLDNPILFSVITSMSYCKIYSDQKFNQSYLRNDWVNEFFQFVWLACLRLQKLYMVEFFERHASNSAFIQLIRQISYIKDSFTDGIPCYTFIWVKRVRSFSIDFV